MNVLARIVTPIGDLGLTIEVGGVDAPRPAAWIAEEPEPQAWRETGGLRAQALVAPVVAGEAAPPHLSATVTRWMCVRLRAERDTADITISALMPDGVASSDIGGDEDVVTADFLTDDWALTIAGADEAWLSRLAAAGQQPANWAELRWPPEDASGGRGLVWNLPALKAGDRAYLLLAAAWCPRRHSKSEFAAWTAAVDTVQADSVASPRNTASDAPRSRAGSPTVAP